MTVDDLEQSLTNWFIGSDANENSFGFVFIWSDFYLFTYYSECYELYYDENFMIRCLDCYEFDYFLVNSQCYFNECPNGYYENSGSCYPCSDIDSDCVEC